MVRVDYHKDETSIEKKVRDFLEAHSFNFALGQSKTYYRQFFGELSNQDKQALLRYVSDFASQPFIRTETATPDLLTRIFLHKESTYTGLTVHYAHRALFVFIFLLQFVHMLNQIIAVVNVNIVWACM